MTDRRLIEDSLPLAEISEQSAREKYIRQGHISTLHMWWARRPLAASRAAVYASLVAAPASEEERQLHHERLKKLVNWDTLDPLHADHGELAAAAAAIEADTRARSTDGRGRVAVLDPFAGGGAIPLEAQRLGCTVAANDLNPVAHIIQRGTLLYPQMFAGQTVGVDAPDGQRKLDGSKQQVLALIHEFQRRANEVQEAVRADLGGLYPSSGSDREVVGYFWVREITCTNPACRASIPVVNQTALANTKSRKVAYHLVPSADRKSVEAQISSGDEIWFDPKAGTYGNNKLLCPCCEQVTSGKQLRALGMQRKFRHRMLAACESSNVERGLFYRLVTEDDIRASSRAEELIASVTELEGDISPDRPSSNARGLSAITRYGLTRFSDLFNTRQMVVLDRFSSEIRRTHDRMLAEAVDTKLAEAVTVYLALALDRIAAQNTTLSRWNSARETNQGLYSKQAASMVWDYIEANPLGSRSGSWSNAVGIISKVIEAASFENPASNVWMGSATDLARRGVVFDAVITDPPYYDSVPYSDISDFFYVWLRRTLKEVLPDVFSATLTPKRREIIQHNPRHGGESAARDFYESQMTLAFREMCNVIVDDGVVVVVFAHKTTAAWETLLTSLLRAGLVVTASWPIDTEMGARTGAQGAASLASSVFIVCRKRSAHDEGFLDDVEPALAERLHERLDYFWSQGIRGADFFMSAIGPAVEVFGKYKRVLKLTGEEVTIAELLDKVRAVVADYALQRIVHGERAGDVDEASRFYVIWRWAFGTADVDSGEAIHMAQSMGCEFTELASDKGVLEKKKDKVSLRGPADRARVKGLGLPTATGVYAPLVDVLHEAANLWAAGERQDLSDFLAEALPPGGADRLQRLAQSIVDVLVPGDKERALYENFLVGSRSLPAPTKKDAPTANQQKLF